MEQLLVSECIAKAIENSTDKKGIIHLSNEPTGAITIIPSEKSVTRG